MWYDVSLFRRNRIVDQWDKGNPDHVANPDSHTIILVYQHEALRQAIVAIAPSRHSAI